MRVFWAYIIPAVCSLTVAAGTANAQSFYPIEMPLSRYSPAPLAVVLDASPDGTRVGGAIVHLGVEHDCIGLRCTGAFTWSLPSGQYSSGGSLQYLNTRHEIGRDYPEEVVSVTKQHALANGSQVEAILFEPAGQIYLNSPLDEYTSVFVEGMSDNADVIAGWKRYWSTEKTEPFWWTSATGIRPIDIGNTDAYSTGISGDGGTVIGASGNGYYFAAREAFRWSESEGIDFLPSLEDGAWSDPTAVSYDGSVIVGTSGINGRERAYRWTAENGTVATDLPAGFTASAAADVSADGNMLVGQLVSAAEHWRYTSFDYPNGFHSANPDSVAASSHAMIWDIVHGTRLLRDVLVNQYGLGEELEGWALVTASAMSADGKVIAGVGVNPAGEFQGWVVRIPEPGAVVLALSGVAAALLGCSRGSLGRRGGLG